MTKDQFTLYASALVRHLLTLGAGLLAARGFTNSGDMVSNLSAAAALFIATVAWSFIQKHKLLEALVAAIDPSQLEALLLQAAQFKKQGADPLLVSHMAGTALAIAQAEAIAANPLLATTVVQPPSAAAVSAPVDAPSAAAPAPVVQPPLGSPPQEPDVLPLTESATPLGGQEEVTQP